MASIIDSFRETFSDNLSFLKLMAFVVPLYISYDMYLKAKTDYTGVFWLLGITVFFLFGFLIETTNGILNEKDSILPSLNPFKLGLSALKGIVAVAPITWISMALANYAVSFISFISWLDITLKVIIWIIATAVSLTSFLMFIKGERIIDAYNLKALSNKAGDLIVAILFFVIQLVFANAFTTLLLAYALIILFGPGPILYFFIAYAIVFNVAVTGHYMAQLQYEVLGYDKETKF